ncbi:MAG: hypothetical protein HY506_02110 [Candidatus Yanofskybacteria bacterium]|nr:hypothetical protein [Candidatus Yanofskybacteria bacterium]
MKNFLTVRVESWLGSVFIIALSAFFVGLFFTATKNFGSDMEILNSDNAKLRTVSSQERNLIDEWLARNNAGFSVEELGYRFIVKKFPDKPWAAN